MSNNNNNNNNNKTSIQSILNTLEKKKYNNNIINQNNSSENAEEFLLNLFKLQNQIKLFHLQTLSYAQHKATDKFVEKISDITDKVLEAYQGLYGRIYLKKQKNINIYNMNDKQVIDFLKKMREYFKDISPKLFNKKDTELFNLMDEISETIDNILYLFTLE
jgi:hypothetical protein